MKDTTVFGDTKLTDLLADIHRASLDRREIILDIIKDLRSLIEGNKKNVADAIMVAPIIKEYLDVLGHSDEHLVKIATVVQRIISAESFQGGKGNDLNEILTDAEKEELMKQVKKQKQDSIKELKEELDKITEELAKAPPIPSFTTKTVS